MENNKLIKTKKVETKVEFVTRTENIKVTQEHIDEINQDIKESIAKNQVVREQCLEIAEKCVMK